MTDALLALAGVCFLLLLSQLSPGPDLFFVFRSALSQGMKAGWAVSSGINLGFAIQSFVVGAFGMWLMEQSWSHWLLAAAGLWLLYLAYKIFPRRWAAAKDELGQGGAERPAYACLFLQGFLCNILNPKCTLFICGLLLEPMRQYGSRYPFYSPLLLASFILTSQLGWMLWSALLQWRPVRGFYLRHTPHIDLCFSLLLAVFALLLLIP